MLKKKKNPFLCYSPERVQTGRNDQEGLRKDPIVLTARKPVL